MKLRANVTIEFDAEDYVDAAKHQHVLEQFLQHIIEKYSDAKLVIRERRERHPDRFDIDGGRLLSAAK
jgi:hypothetical protein